MNVRRALLLAIPVVMSMGACTSGPDIPVEHKTSNPVEALSGDGPEPGRFEQEWQTKAAGADPKVMLVDGHLISRTATGIDLYDPRTGKPAWHYREPGREIMGLAATDGVVIVNTTNQGDRVSSRHTVGLDATTGKLLWENTDRWYLAYETSTIGSSVPGVAGSGTFVVQPTEASERLGIDARTGDERWKVTASDIADETCAPRRASTKKAGRGELVNVLIRCSIEEGGRSSTWVLGGLDSANGEVRWGRETTSSARVVQRGKVTLFQESMDHGPELIGNDGKRLFAGPADSLCSSHTCELYVVADRAVLTFQTRQPDGPRKDLLAIVDLTTGRVQVRAARASVAAAFAAGGQHLYSVQALLDNSGRSYLLPTALRTFEVGTGKVAQSPLPLDNGLHTRGQGQQHQVLGVGGKRLFVTRRTGDGGVEIRSFAPIGSKEPLELGGVPAAAWPEPCGLLAGLPLDEPARTYDRITIGASDLVLVCNQHIRDQGYVRVGIDWVGATAQESAALFPGRPSKIPGVDEEITKSAVVTMIRVGRYVVTIDIPRHRDRVARAVAANLRRRSPHP